MRLVRQIESTTEFDVLDFMLRVVKGKHKFWMNATYCVGNYANEFSIDFPFSLAEFDVRRIKWSSLRNVDDEKSASLARGCQTARNCRPKKRFRWVDQTYFVDFSLGNMLKSSSKHATQVETVVRAHALHVVWLQSLASLCVCYVNPRGRNENRLGKRKQKFVLSPKWLLVFVCYMILRSVKCNEFLKTTSFHHLRIDKGDSKELKRWSLISIRRLLRWSWPEKKWRVAGNENGKDLLKKIVAESFLKLFPFILKVFHVLCHWMERLTKEPASFTKFPFNLTRSSESRMIIEIVISNFVLNPFLSFSDGKVKVLRSTLLPIADKKLSALIYSWKSA